MRLEHLILERLKTLNKQNDTQVSSTYSKDALVFLLWLVFKNKPTRISNREEEIEDEERYITYHSYFITHKESRSSAG